MAIQRPDLSKFDHSKNGSANGKSKSSKDDSGDSGMMIEFAKAAMPMIPDKFKYIIAVAVFFLGFGIISFNYIMITSIGWGYFLLIVSTLQIFQIYPHIKKYIKKK